MIISLSNIVKAIFCCAIIRATGLNVWGFFLVGFFMGTMRVSYVYPVT